MPNTLGQRGISNLGAKVGSRVEAAMVVSKTPDNKDPLQTLFTHKGDCSNIALEDRLEVRKNSALHAPKSFDNLRLRSDGGALDASTDQ